jgi:hypothetical protein
MNSVSYKEKYEADREFGIAEEEKQFAVLKSKFGDDLERMTGRYCKMDFKSQNCYVELKSRRCNKDTYEDTMVSESKLKYAEKRGTPTFFAFNFQDGIYYWKYNKEDIENGKVNIRDGGRFDRGRPEKNSYAFIHKDLLVAI